MDHQDIKNAISGVLVDGVQETFQVATSLLQVPPAMDSATTGQFVDAIIPLGERMLSRLVVGALLPRETLEMTEAGRHAEDA